MTTAARHGSRKRSTATSKPSEAAGHGPRARVKPEPASVTILAEDNYDENALPGSLFLDGDEVPAADEAEGAVDDWPGMDGDDEEVSSDPDSVGPRRRH